jgi:hypothetical protein
VVIVGVKRPNTGRTVEQAAQACVAMWVVHTVEVAAYGRRHLTGPMTPDNEPSPADAVERAILHEYALETTKRLHERADALGLDPVEVNAGFEFCANSVPWAEMLDHYTNALSFIGGRLAPS